ncbi:MAG: tyrosyl-tRNA synthetase [Thermotogaceae bacterium]|nr:tyrosyl-tRNA synthetase [Thermotogaceae bacterium]
MVSVASYEEQLKKLKRNVVDLVTEEELLEKLKENRPLRVKLGVDPSRPDLHLGHLVVLKKLREFQDMGHTVILIIGDFTARIGDPSGRSQIRPMLSAEEVRENAKTYSEQAFKVLDKEKTELRYNSEWLEALNFEDVIRLTAKFTVARMLEREDFSKRLEAGEPLSISELLYPIAQAYDSVMIKADVELGGTDQLFNLLVGRKLQQDYGQKPQIVMTMPLIEGTDGHLKMSKSYDNYIAFNDPPDQMYGKLMSIPDELILKYMRLLTDISDEEIEEYGIKMEGKEINPRDVKMRLAWEVVSFFYNESEAERAQENFIRVFREKKLPQEMEEIVVNDTKKSIVDLLFENKIVQSKSEAKRLIVQGGVKIDEEKITDPFVEVEIRNDMVLQIGKRRFFKIKKNFG